MLFESNRGQFASPAQFVAHSGAYSLALSPHEATLFLPPVASRHAYSSNVLRIRLMGANAHPRLSGEQPLATRVNYFVGKDPKNWHSDIPTVGRVKYENVYSGIDLVYYGNEGQMEYDFVVSPGADPNRIKMNFTGADRLELDGHGDLLLHIGRQLVKQHAPVIYQMEDGQRRRVAGRYVLQSKREVGFQLGAYDASQTLVIDPVLQYGTFLASDIPPEYNSWDKVVDVALSQDGAAYILGRITYTTSGDLSYYKRASSIAGKVPDTSIGKLTNKSCQIYVAKISADGSKLDFLTFLSNDTYGDSNDIGIIPAALALGNDSSVYLTGYGVKSDFPTTGAAIQQQGADATKKSAFVTRLSSTGTLVASLLVRSSSVDDLAVSSSGRVYLVGGGNIPVKNGFNLTTGAAFLMVIDSSLAGPQSLIYSTHVDATNDGDGTFRISVAVDSTGKAVVCGDTNSSTFRLKNALQSDPKGGAIHAFIAKINPGAVGEESLLWSTYFGAFSTTAKDVAVDDNDDVYVVGSTYGRASLPLTPTKFGTCALNSACGYVLKMSGEGSSFSRCLLFGGSDPDSRNVTVEDLRMDSAPSGEVAVSGNTWSPDFPLKSSLVSTVASANIPTAFALKLAASGAPEYSTLLGGTTRPADAHPTYYRPTQVFCVSLNSSGEVAVGGTTTNRDLPIFRAIQPELARYVDVSDDKLYAKPNGFVLKFKGGSLLVNSQGDSPDADTSDGACDTGKTLSNGQSECTLRAAIQEANVRGAASGTTTPTPQLIQFNIKEGVVSGTFPKISLKTALPALNVPITVDGTTQPTVKRVWLNGVSGGAMSGLVVAGGASAIKGLLINQMRGDGILVRTKGNNKIENCWVGLSDKGIADSKTGVSGSGIHILDSPSNIVGGASESKRCVIGGNGGNGVWIDGGKSTNNSVQGCFIGTDVSGTQKVGNKIGVSVGPEKTQTTVLALNAQIGGSSGTPGAGAGNVISANRFGGVVLNSSSGARVQGNLIGTDKTGTKALGNNIGVNVFAAPGNTIGGSPNVISGNAFGIALLLSATTGNSVQNNLVGLDKSGTKALPNDTGIVLCASSSNAIGSNGRNVVSGNKQVGIALLAEIQYGEPVNGVPQFIKGAANKNTLAQNYLGLDKSGAKALPNAIGLTLDKCENTTVSKNVVSGNSAVGVFMKGRCFKTNFSGNLVGTSATGTSAVANGVYGVLMQEADYNVFDGNTLSGNGVAGLVLGGTFPPGIPAPLKTEAGGPTHNTFTRNFIGTNSGGTSAVPNGSAATNGIGAGVLVLPSTSSDPFTGASYNVVGASGKGNVISGNRGAGVLFVGIDGADKAPQNAANATLQSNFIGTGASGKTGVPNSGSGVGVVKGAAKIGGSGTAGNIIAFNGGDGVTVTSGSGNAIVGNAIFSNKKLGIDLGGDGVTTNSTTGTPNSKRPNLAQNFPELISAQVASGKTTIVALLKAVTKTTYRIEFFLNGTRDASGYGEGEKFISAVNVTTDSSGLAKFSTTLGVALSGTQSLSMTATDDKGNTSEFSGLSRAISGRVYVTVTDPKNTKATLKQGLANLRVERLDAEGAVKETTGTDAEGFYVFVGVPNGTWTIKPSSKTGNYDTQFDPATLKATVSSDKPSVSGLDFTTYSIYGRVKDVAGKPLANQTVSLVGTGRSVKTGKDGTYRFDSLGKKQYDVEFGDTFSPHFKIVSLPTSGTAGVSPNARVDAQQGLSLSGFVEDASGKPLANVPIELVGTNITPTVTDQQGRYEFEGLPAATYKVAPKSNAGKFTPSSRTVTLKDKSVDSVDFTKQAASPNAISGGDA